MRVALFFIISLWFQVQAIAADPAIIVRDFLDKCQKDSLLESMLRVVAVDPKGDNLSCDALKVKTDVYIAVDDEYYGDLARPDALFRSSVESAETMLNKLSAPDMAARTVIRRQESQESNMVIVGPLKPTSNPSGYTELNGANHN